MLSSQPGLDRLLPTSTRGIGSLPEELLLTVLELLERQDQVAINQTNSRLYKASMPVVWREVDLVDTCTSHEEAQDQHDDTPILRLLLTFVNKPHIANCVRVLSHRCHLDAPSILDSWGGLAQTPFCSQTLSIDPRTIWLVVKAVANLNNVHTLRIVFGHPMLTEALLRCFFDSRRRVTPYYNGPVKRLWLENCRISAGLNVNMKDFPYDLPPMLDFDGVESVRFRRLPMDFKTYNSYDNPRGQNEYVHERSSDDSKQFEEGISLSLTAPTDHWEHIIQRLMSFGPGEVASRRALVDHLETVRMWDDQIYDDLDREICLPFDIDYATGYHRGRQNEPLEQYYGDTLQTGLKTDEDIEILKAVRSETRYLRSNLREKDWPAFGRLPWQRTQREQIPGTKAAIQMLHSASQTLTSLNLDWVMTWFPNGKELHYHTLFQDLFACRFPHLRAFQLRNCVVRETKMPSSVYLLAPLTSSTGPGGLEFMESHPHLKCLAWHIEHILPPRPSSPDIEARIASLVSNLDRTLDDLRVDADHADHGEPLSDSTFCSRPDARLSRLRFINDFARHLTSLTSIKIEGGIPRDERRETLRALHRCALTKIVLISVAWPIGNTWGVNGEDAIEAISDFDGAGLEEEDVRAVRADSGLTSFSPRPGEDFVFTPEYGWDGGQPSMLHTMLSLFGNTITELKFCGYQGAALLYDPTPITAALLAPLISFDHLKRLTLSFWLNTIFEGQKRDAEVIQYWQNSKAPTSTALVTASSSDEEEENPWAHRLRTEFAPEALVKRIVEFVGSKISRRAKAREGGIHVRASFALGDFGGVFDVDVWIGVDAAGGEDVCLGSTGPMENSDPERRREKLDHRRWF